MNRKILHTPDGVRDIYAQECRRKLRLESGVRKVFNSYGYRDIETPTFEFFDVFGSNVGTIPSNQLYKFFDREGNTLALRPDFTPSIARACSRYFMDQTIPVRLCYQGNAFINNSSYQGRLKETTQMGAELIGDGSVDADVELLSMVIDAVRSTGLEEFQISVGNVQYFRALLQMADLDETEEEEIAELIRNKNRFGVEKRLSGKDLDSSLLQALASLPVMTGGVEILDQALEQAPGKEAAEACARLKELYNLLQISGQERYISFDLGMMSSYMYYTGIIFRGYTYGTGEAIVKGGRYDHLLEKFGTAAPSTGFVIVVDQLMNALSRQKAFADSADDSLLRLVYDAEHREEAIRRAALLRAEGCHVELIRSDCSVQEKQLIKETAGESVRVEWMITDVSAIPGGDTAKIGGGK